MQMFDSMLRKVKRSDVVRRMARSGEYMRMRDVFVNNGRNSRVDQSTRENIVRKFEIIDKKVTIASTPLEGLILAEIMISLECEGDIVECGCFEGGSSAKLSVVANATGRKIAIFDSFEGLPEVDDDNLNDFHARRGSEWVTEWTAGRYASRLEQVRANVDTYGCGDACRYTKGWFCDTMIDENLPEHVAMAFVDVDIASSAKECLLALWPRLSNGGVFVSHDVAYIKVMQVFYEHAIWSEVLKSTPPIFFGAGFGLGDLAPHIGFAVKGDVSAEYINSLTLEK